MLSSNPVIVPTVYPKSAPSGRTVVKAKEGSKREEAAEKKKFGKGYPAFEKKEDKKKK